MYSSQFFYYLLKYQTLRKINFEIFNITCPASKQDTMIKKLRQNPMYGLLSNSFAIFWYETKPPTSVIKYMNKLAESILLSIAFFKSGRFLTT